MNGFFTACDIIKMLYNIKQLLDGEAKLIYVVHLKAFLFKWDNKINVYIF
jgi:hypothetical protein